MKINTKIEDVLEGTQDLIDVHHDVWIAKKAASLGFPVAGTVKDIYEDAVIFIAPMWAWEWKPDRIKIGRVLHIEEDGRIRWFSILTEDGTQVPCAYGEFYNCFFALPEDTEDFAR